MFLADPVIVRGSIHQPYISYRVQEIPSFPSRQQEVHSVMYWARELWLAHGTENQPLKTIIYFMSKAKVNDFYHTYQPLACHFHADLEDQVKQSQLHDFLTNPKKTILAATGAIGAGYDFPAIQLVIHWEGAWGITDFVQESGRLGHQPGQLGWSYCLITARERAPHARDSVDRALFRDYLNEAICRRRPIHLTFDQKVIDQCGSHDQPCDLCMTRAQAYSQVTRAAQAAVNLHQGRADRLLAICQAFDQKFCLWHWLSAIHFKEGEERAHSIASQAMQHVTWQCRGVGGDNWPKRFDSSRANLAFTTDSCCFTCLKPTRVCKQSPDPRGGCASSRILPYWLAVSHLAYNELGQGFPEFSERYGLHGGEKGAPWLQKLLAVDLEYFGTQALAGVVLFMLILDQYGPELFPDLDFSSD